MPFKITLRSIDDIKRFRRKITNLNIQLFAFQAITIRRLANEIIVNKIHQRMKSKNFSEKIIRETILDNIEFIGDKKIRLHFRSEYVSEDENKFDVALGREEGTRGHMIRPTEKLALYGGEKWPFFSSGHWVSGIPSHYIIKNTVLEFAGQLQDAYNDAQDKWYQKNLEGVAVAS